MNTKDLQHILKACDLADDNLLISGKHGIGKSQSVGQYATAQDYHFEEVFLSMMDTGDMIGIPRTVQRGSTTVTVWAEPDYFQRITDAAFPLEVTYDSLVFADKDFADIVKSELGAATIDRTSLNTLYCKHYNLPDDGLLIVRKDSRIHTTSGKRSLLFLDELNRSNLDVRQASLQLVLNKEIHCHKLPYINGKCTVIVSAINPSDGYDVDELDAALVDRFCEVFLESDTPSWLSWARENNINPVICDFLTENSDRLHWTPTDQGIGPTPRSWAKLSAFLDHLDSIPPETHYEIFKGKIGEEIGAQFAVFLRDYDRVLKIEDIEAIVEKHSKKSDNPKTIAKHIEKMLKGKEAMQKSQLAEALYEKYVTDDAAPESALVFLSYLYALDFEILAGFLKSKKEEDIQISRKLATLDSVNDKELFRRIRSQVTENE